MFKLFLLFETLLAFIIGLFACGAFTNDLESTFNQWEPEPSDNVLVYDEFDGTALYNGEIINIHEALSKRYEDPNDTVLMLVDDGLIYGVHQVYDIDNYDYYCNVDIYTYDIAREKIEVLYTGQYRPQIAGEDIGALSVEFYYFNRKIFIYDGVCVTSYNIDTETASECTLNDIKSAKYERKYQLKHCQDGYGILKTLVVLGEGVEITLTPEYLAPRNTYIQELTRLEDKYAMWNGGDPIDDFFYSSRVSGEYVFWVCCVRDDDGDANGVVFSYNIESEEVSYIYQKFTWDSPRNLILIPVE